MSSSPPIVLTFAGSDPTGGAGLQADVLTIASCGCHPVSVLTAITVQDTRGVESLHAVDAALVRAQAHALLADLRIAAFKLGVLGSRENARAVAELLALHPRVPVVLDPVLASGRGDPLAGEDTVHALREFLLPLATVATPNSVEARRLGGCAALADCAKALLARGAGYVLVTGTHEEAPEVTNTLYGAHGAVREDRWPRLPASYHGSGCTLASALAAGLARGLDVPQAAREAQAFTWQALARGFRPGAGQHLPHRGLAPGA
ncbi:MAG TPA: hydroxymethylpyrimidine/phosphomethylpyrimidine kinase [Burkholderiales bacterium]|nr:hydroxymethylpyrimidine/phosphomethylpyrimidine kinase [Burkholderiales bacterium]